MIAMLLTVAPTGCVIPDGCGNHTEAIHALVDDQVMDLDQDGQFRPHEPATRLETVQAIYRRFDLHPANADQFPDVQSVEADALATEGIIAGFADGTFGPDRHVTRGQLATIIDRTVHLGRSRPPSPPAPFDDVKAGQGHGDAIGWLVAEGVVSGFGDGTFRPHDPVSRGQLATIIYQQTDSTPYEPTKK